MASGAKNITAGYGRAHDMQFRYVRTETDPHEHWIDPTKPLLLSRGESEDRGFGILPRIDRGRARRRQLLMAAKTFAPPVKAKDADVYLLTGQTFNEFPDLLTTDGTFQRVAQSEQRQSAEGAIPLGHG